ncbi:unnamed protein product [Haemonchus placei]|uniref:CP2 domain-containing protein n=1 Tax=Haemonchus placei TaxID=6290 RepID=A0A0N4WMN7_HAEPC|nr:unnamed protein product [Haemonchus placei]
MKLGFDSNVVATMSQFQLEQSSVIKTAPPGRQLEFSPKNEPIDLAPLTQSNLQDLSKMQPIDLNYYNTNYQRAYEYAAIGLGGHNQSSLIPAPSTAGQLYYGFPNGVVQQDWGRPMDTYTAYPRATTLQYNPQDASGTTTAAQEQRTVYKGVDMPSPVDSGIGADLSMITGAKEEFFQTDTMLDRSAERALSHRDSPVVIPKLHNPLGFQYVLEAPISTSVRKEDDRMTYVNKGQFYTVSLDYIPDINKPLKSVTVKSQLMIVFREDKTYEEEIKTWQFWHSRQHSAKQRILEVDSKNSSGMIGQIEEIAHNAVQFYWNPSENGVKISIATQCLSTDFSNQKGVKGLPLHVQIDTYDGDNDKQPFHRGYCQIKVFCDKGAERKLRDEDKRNQKRKLAGNHHCRHLSVGRGCPSLLCCIAGANRKMLHENRRDEKRRIQGTLFSVCSLCVLVPSIHVFPLRPSVRSRASWLKIRIYVQLQNPFILCVVLTKPSEGVPVNPFFSGALSGRKKTEGEYHEPCERSEFYHMRELDKPAALFIAPDEYDSRYLDGTSIGYDGLSDMEPVAKRPRPSERIMLYVRKRDDQIYTPLHVIPPSLDGLAQAVAHKFGIDSQKISGLYKRCAKGVTVKMDDDMLRHYCNEDTFILDVEPSPEDSTCFAATLVEIMPPQYQSSSG